MKIILIKNIFHLQQTGFVHLLNQCMLVGLGQDNNFGKKIIGNGQPVHRQWIHSFTTWGSIYECPMNDQADIRQIMESAGTNCYKYNYCIQVVSIKLNILINSTALLACPFTFFIFYTGKQIETHSYFLRIIL